MAEGTRKSQATPNNPGAKSRANPQWGRKVQLDHNKAKFIKLVGEGYSFADAARMLGRKPGLEKYYRRTDPQFAIDLELARNKRDGVRVEKMRENADLTFEEFSERYLHQKLFTHQMQWVDLLEGREPRGLHNTQRFEAGDRNFVVINTPPGHAKSTTITCNYVTYRVCMDPTVRVVIISKTQGMAAKFVRGVKERLTSRLYQDLIRDFAPSEGFNKGNAVWTANRVYVNTEGVLENADPDELRKETVEKDPTLEALGIGGHIYGARADLIILDDVIDTENVGGVENQIEWLQKMVMSRVDDYGRIAVVGTRVNSVDFYSELLNPGRYPEEDSPWTYLSQPAVLEYAEDPEDWQVLWPWSNQPKPGDSNGPNAEGLYPKWTGPSLAKVRSRIDPRTWAMVYQQEQISEAAVFPAEAVMGCVDSMRMPGYLYGPHEGGGLDKGRDWFVVAGLDPATVAGFTACIVLAVNTRTRMRRIIEVSNKRMTPAAMNSMIKEFTTKYEVDEWRVEANAFQAYMTQNPELQQFMANRGVKWTEHQTHRNKWDHEFGVSSMAMLFNGWQDGNNLIELPAKRTEGVRNLIEQLIAWAPELPKTQKTDCVMALWFACIRANELTSMLSSGDMFTQGSEFVTPMDLEERQVIDIDEYLANQRLWGNGQVA